MKTRFNRAIALILSMSVLAFLGVGTAGTASAAPPARATTESVPITGALADGTQVFDGTFALTEFAVQDGELVALGTLTGTVTDPVTQAVQPVTEAVAMPVDTAQSGGSCEILNLVLGPLNLDLLGLVVFLDTVTLNITAEQGPGNLLGNLLCAVANLLNGPTGLNAILTQIANLLNRVLGILG